MWRGDLIRKLLADKEMTNKELSEILIMGSVNAMANSSKIVMRSTASRREAATAGFYSNIFLAASMGLFRITNRGDTEVEETKCTSNKTVSQSSNRWGRKQFEKKGEALLGHFSSNRQECFELLANMMVEFLHPMEG